MRTVANFPEEIYCYVQIGFQAKIDG